MLFAKADTYGIAGLISNPLAELSGNILLTDISVNKVVVQCLQYALDNISTESSDDDKK